MQLNMRLNRGEVHLWVVRLEASEENFARALALLAADEIARAERFRFERHRRAYVIGRAALRALLSGYLGLDPAAIAFTYGPQGKPALADAACSVRFNASNSGQLAAFAFTEACEIGVDVEQHRPLHDLEAIAQRFFSPDETAELLALPASDRDSAFFNCWTRKEAYIKAMGGGLSIPLDSFRVTLRPGDAAGMVSIEGSAEAAWAWTVHAFDPGPPDYKGAITYRASPRALQIKRAASADQLLDARCSTFE
jgi:4'-phosphopantetheinyl transferase